MRFATPHFHRRILAFALPFALTLVVAGCAPDRALVEDFDGDDDAVLADGEPHVPRTLRVLELATWDGSGEAVHPDFAQMSLWRHPFLLAATPYTGGNSALENPVLYSRGDDFQWSPVSGSALPIARPSAGYLSDPDVVAIPSSGEVWVYYRQADTRNTIYLIRTRDGLRYDPPLEVVAGANHTVISPAVVRRDSTRWRMWSVNAGSDGCSAASTTVELRRSLNGREWTRPVTVSLPQPAGYSVWHIDVQWIPSRREYWALYNVKRPGSCATKAIFFATSQDGAKWKTYPSPLLTAGVIPEFSHVVYRSTFAYDPSSDNIRLWFSGAHYDIETARWVWRTAYDRRSRSDVFGTIGKAMSAATAQRIATPAPGSFTPP